MKDGFIRIACVTPEVRVADCIHNGNEIIKAMKEASENGAKIVVFPELCITGYTCGDLFEQETLLQGALDALALIMKQTSYLSTIGIVGLPISFKGKLYNCAAVFYEGELLGLVPKINIPNHSEFYEQRYFTSGVVSCARDEENNWHYSSKIPYGGCVFGALQTFTCDDMPEFSFGVEICEDVWVADTPSVKMAQSGATIIINLSCSDEIIGKAEYRRTILKAKSGSLLCAYAYADSGMGESTQDMVFAGHNLILENGTCLAESELFKNEIIYADVDVKRLDAERRRSTTFAPFKEEIYHNTSFSMEIEETKLQRKIEPMPFVPSGDYELAKRCETILTLQATGLATRLKHIGCKTAVVGLSGGLDSTLALIVMVHAFDMLNLDRSGIITVTMPCFGTTDRTYQNACKLAESYGAKLIEVPIQKSVRQHFEDIGHDESNHDVTYENSQARERTQVLMDLANKMNGIVIGTGDLSELALGWATYNGDHMSMYAVNASIPKTLVRYLVRYESSHVDKNLSMILLDILDTPVSPELLPPEKDGTIAQKTEDLVGPYELHDFFLYYVLRFGFSPKKIYRMAMIAFKGEYDKETILKWLRTFYRRFFYQQFKRYCLPDSPKVGSVTLSPRGDWRMPSDACSTLWLAELDSIS
ncbi:MAG: NAD(+) synthase [Ruminococcus sp.]|nr:NAD(+) synthase [Ruminococcus sp.]